MDAVKPAVHGKCAVSGWTDNRAIFVCQFLGTVRKSIIPSAHFYIFLDPLSSRVLKQRMRNPSTAVIFLRSTLGFGGLATVHSAAAAAGFLSSQST